MTLEDKERGKRIMSKALEIATPSKTNDELRNTILTYGVIIYQLKQKIIQLETDNSKYIKVLLAIQENNLDKLKDELLGAYQELKEKLDDTSHMLDLIKMSGGTIDILVLALIH
jgi:hypothetical protein